MTGRGEEGVFPGAESRQSLGQTVRLGAQLDRLEALIRRQVDDAEATGEQVRALTRHLTATPAPTALDERLAELLDRAESAHRQLEDLAGAVTRLNRVQFKTNALLDGKGEQVAQALAVLQEIATRREEAGRARGIEEAQRLEELRAEGRAELAAGLLPVLDAVERAIESGVALLKRRRTETLGPGAGVWRTIRRVLGGGARMSDARQSAFTGPLASWIEGLALGRERLLALLASEDIAPMAAEDRAFDPRLHVAMATEEREDVAPDTVVRVLRTGYLCGQAPLRFAEVVVSREPTAPSDANQQ